MMRIVHAPRFIPLSEMDERLEKNIDTLKKLLANTAVQKWDRYKVLILLEDSIKLQTTIKRQICQLKESFSLN